MVINDFLAKEYFEDIDKHQVFRSRYYTLNENEINEFASIWHPQLAKPGSDIIASKLHLQSICAKLINELKPGLALIADMGLNNLRWLSPGRPGDTFVLEMKV